MLPARGQRGSLAAVLFAGLILICAAVGAIGYDLAHVVTAQNELLNAVEAAAIGGAQSLSDGAQMAEYHALETAERNFADGDPVSNGSPGTTVVAVAQDPDIQDPGFVEVSAERVVEHRLARIFSRATDTVVARAVAGAGGPARKVSSNQLFPLAMSIDTVPRAAGGNGNGNGGGNSQPAIDSIPLNQKRIGDTVQLYINSQQYKNAAFTSLTEPTANANWIRSAVDQYIGLADKIPGFMPSVEIGDSIYLNNGVVGQKHLARDPRYTMLLGMPYIVVPVISGNPPFNQTRSVVGFIAIKVTDVTINQAGGVVETISGTLVSGLVTGQTGELPASGSAQTDAALEELSAQVIRLVNNRSLLD